jgi:type II restriction enzyme
MLQALVQRYCSDPESVYHTWFLGEERLKAFRTIRRGIQAVADDIFKGRFPRDFRGSSLEVVMTAITEQKQVFQGAAHAFYWKPKLRIPDIYEDRVNQLGFARFLDEALKAVRENQILAAIHRLDALGIKGMGPAASNLLYFLHPTAVPAFNTAILGGFNALTGSKLKLGSWRDYLTLREGVLSLNNQFPGHFSRDLGAVSGFLFDIGIGKIAMDGNAGTALAFEEKKHQKTMEKRHQEVLADARESTLHARMQAHLLKVGRALGYQVWVARNDRQAPDCHGGGRLGEQTLTALPSMGLTPEVLNTVELIDVLWLQEGQVICAFEVEKSTSIYSGILRLQDLSLSLPDSGPHLYLVAPDDREGEVRAQMVRPTFRELSNKPALITFTDIETHCEAMCRFGSDREILTRIARKI